MVFLELGDCVNCTCAHNHLLVNRVFQFDPTRTLTIRKKFVAEMNKRFRALKGLIRRSIVDNDCFGLRPQTIPLAEARPGQFKFERSADKVEAFMDWLKEQEEAGILEIIERERLGGAVEEPWTNIYIDSAYQAGIRRARSELRAQGVDIPEFGPVGDPITAAFNQPIHADRVGLIYTRVYSELKGISAAMDQQISRVLAQGLAEGRNPLVIAQMINDRVDKIGLTRAKTLARTEVIRAHHIANITEYRNAGIEKVRVRAEWLTAGDGRVCEVCADYERRTRRNPMTLDEVEGLIPAHPNCRCVAIPVVGDAEKAEPEDPVAANIHPDFQDLYLEEKRRYAEQWKQWIDEYRWPAAPRGIEPGTLYHPDRFKIPTMPTMVRDFVQADPDLRVAYEAVDHWQTDSFLPQPMALKQAAKEVEFSKIDVLFKEFMSPSDISAALSEFVNNRELYQRAYVKLRAFNQAYMETVLKQEKFTLYRGTDGPEGKLIARQFQEEARRNIRRNKFFINDPNLAGYSSDKGVAMRFGELAGGVTIQRIFDAKDVIVHEHLFHGITRRYATEREYIVKGGKITVNRENLFF